MFLKILFMVQYECNYEGKFMFIFCCLSNALMLVSVQGCVNRLKVDLGFVWICVDLYKIMQCELM